LNRYRLDDAELLLVAQGAAAEVARAVADHARRVHRFKVGVVGVTWLRPLPVAELAEVLDGRRAVAVIEAADDALAAHSPLFRELQAVVGSSDGWVSARCAGSWPDPARLLALCELLRRRDRPQRVQLEYVPHPQSTGYPRRDALLQCVANGYRPLRDPELPETEPIGMDPRGGASIGLVGREAELPPDALAVLSEAVAAECGPFVRGTASCPEPGAWQARVRAAPTEFSDPGPRDPVPLLLVATHDFRDLGEPLAKVRRGASVLMATGDPPARIWRGLPSAWRREVRERELRLFAVGPAFDAGIEAIRAFLRGEEESLLEAGSLREVPWPDLEDPEATDGELPQVVRRIEHVRSAHDSLPRFWGEVVQPRQGGATERVPEPLTASGAVPAGASALEREPSAALLPAFDPEKCTGCGRCWSVCPDAAIGVTVLGVESLLGAASRLAGTEGRVADALRRAHKHLAGRVATEIVKGDAEQLTAETCHEAWRWVASRMDVSDADRPEYEDTMRATAVAVSGLRPAVTRPFFHDVEEQGKGTGELLVLAVDPRACQGCNLCVSACSDEALRSVDRTHELRGEFEERWRAWEKLPDTPGATLARAVKHPDVGPLAGALLSRHCAQAQIGGGPGAEPGSGEQLAGRLVSAFVEHREQQHVASLLKTLDEVREKLEQKVSERLSESLSTAAPDTLADALARVTHGRAALSELGKQLDALGAPATFDRRALLRMTRLCGELDRYRHRMVSGEDGLGRTRFGVVVTTGTVAEWAARFPGNPYYAPLTLATTSQGVELARGIARGLVADHVELQRTLRRSRLESEDAPAGRAARLDVIESLTWKDLNREERIGCPPLVLLGDDTGMLDHGLEALARLLASDLPVKVVLLDGRGQLGGGPEPALFAMVQQRAFVLAASLAHPEHLARGLADALAWPGPALIHLHAPSPRRHGFPAEAMLERGRAAVEGRAHLLFRYDPSAEGMFGLRASLEGNPGLDEDWGGLCFAEWAAGESRFAEHFAPLESDDGTPLLDWLSLHEAARQGKVPFIEVNGRRLAVGERMAEATGERLSAWNTLRELIGAGPLAERLRSELEKEFEADYQSRLYDLNAEHMARIAELRSGGDQQAVAQLRDRLMTLAGYPPKVPPQEEVE
jgi:pyruvate-ferredoxin/flavodoxin oxidoreductase